MSEYNIQMNKYNALNAEYDQLYPATKIKNVNGLDTALQNKLGGVESADHPGCYYRMVGSVVEWFNPPMELGEEYRTTERYLGKPVYVKLVNFGELPNNTYKDVSPNVNNLDKIIIDLSLSIITNGTTNLLPTFSAIENIMFHGGNIRVATTDDRSGYKAMFCIKYTKTTD